MFYINSPEAINAICAGAKEKNTMMVISDIVLHAKAFFGDVFGEFIRQWRVLGLMSTETEIEIRIDMSYLVPFLNIVCIKYDITSVNHLKEYVMPYRFTYIVTNKWSSVGFSPIKININTMTKKLFKATLSEFDVDLLAEDDASMYVRNCPMAIRCSMDKINLIKDRICRKRFCLTDHITPLTCSKQITYTIEKAVDMVSNDWLMDDFFLKEKSWIVAKWCNIVNRGLEIRQATDMKKCDECCICQEKFNTNDIVVNTVCNHNFHWSCHTTGDPNGLSQWVKGQNKTSCPFCRNPMF